MCQANGLLSSFRVGPQILFPAPIWPLCPAPCWVPSTRSPRLVFCQPSSLGVGGLFHHPWSWPVVPGPPELWTMEGPGKSNVGSRALCGKPSSHPESHFPSLSVLLVLPWEEKSPRVASVSWPSFYPPFFLFKKQRAEPVPGHQQLWDLALSYFLVESPNTFDFQQVPWVGFP